MYKIKENKKRMNITIDREMFEWLKALALLRKTSMSIEIAKVIEYVRDIRGTSFYGEEELSIVYKLRKILHENEEKIKK